MIVCVQLNYIADIDFPVLHKSQEMTFDKILVGLKTKVHFDQLVTTNILTLTRKVCYDKVNIWFSPIALHKADNCDINQVMECIINNLDQDNNDDELRQLGNP